MIYYVNMYFSESFLGDIGKVISIFLTPAMFKHKRCDISKLRTRIVRLIIVDSSRRFNSYRMAAINISCSSLGSLDAPSLVFPDGKGTVSKRDNLCFISKILKG